MPFLKFLPKFSIPKFNIPKLGSPSATTKALRVSEVGGLSTVVAIVTVVALPPLSVFLSLWEATRAWAVHLSLTLLVVFWAFRLIGPRDSEAAKNRYQYVSVLVFLAFVMTLVAATGRFLSPFFFSLYLVAIILAFIFSPIVSFAFLATLIGLFAFYGMGQVDLTYDFLTLTSLLSVIPITLYLRKRYLELKSQRKEILVLQGEDKKEYQTVVEGLLDNVITQLVTNTRQPVTYIKQAAMVLGSKKSPGIETVKHYTERIATNAEEVLTRINEFEHKATGRKVLSSFHEKAEI